MQPLTPETIEAGYVSPLIDLWTEQPGVESLSISARFEDWWKQHPKPRHLRRQLDAPKPYRVSVGRVLAARSAHGDFADYHERFGHDTELTCQCGRRKSGALLREQMKSLKQNKAEQAREGFADREVGKLGDVYTEE